jgi:DNA-binding protein H-NS
MPNSAPASDLETLSKSELEALQRQVQQALSKSEARRKKDAIAAVERVVKDYGLTLEEVFAAAGAGKSKRPSGGMGQTSAKFRNPESPSQTWSGRGRRPGWFKAHLEAGKSEDELRV